MMMYLMSNGRRKKHHTLTLLWPKQPPFDWQYETQHAQLQYNHSSCSTKLICDAWSRHRDWCFGCLLHLIHPKHRRSFQCCSIFREPQVKEGKNASCRDCLRHAKIHEGETYL